MNLSPERKPEMRPAVPAATPSGVRSTPRQSAESADPTEQLRFEVFSRIDTLAPEIVATRRSFHRYPEVGWTEFCTAARVATALESWGWQVRAGPAVTAAWARMGVPGPAELEAAWQRARELVLTPGIAGDWGPQERLLRWLEIMRGGFTGIVADLPLGSRGEQQPLVAFRFDLDALPLPESTDPSHPPALNGYVSTRPGVMHACGHDGHIAMGLALGRLAPLLAPHLRGRLRLIFQPAEEGCRGARAMLAAGACDGVTALICVHLGLGLPTGTVAGGAVDFLACSQYEAVFQGKSAHAGIAPQEGRSALLAAAQAALALATLPQDSRAITRVNVGRLISGTAANIVPAHAQLLFETRSSRTEVNAELGERAEAIIQGTATAFACSAYLTRIGEGAAENSNPELAHLVAEAAATIPQVRQVILHHPFGASEDATLLMEATHRQGGKATYILLGADTASAHHSSTFEFDETALPIGVKLLASTLITLAAPASAG
ncbi:MAG: amidohydrolase [Limnochordales bacterium]|nr:amidohydrolase [Limnochordales bacterium]